VFDRGCPLGNCGTGHIHNIDSRRANFKKVLVGLRDQFKSGNGSSTVKSYKWKVGAYDVECSKECGKPLTKRTRKTVCGDGNGTVVADSQCKSDGPKPKTEDICNATSVCGDPSVTYTFETSPWNPLVCPNKCGLPASSLSRSVICVGDDNTIASNSVCKGLLHSFGHSTSYAPTFHLYDLTVLLPLPDLN
jgi:hypothetical protein